MSINMPASYQAQTTHRFPLLGSQTPKSERLVKIQLQKNPQCHPPKLLLKPSPFPFFQKKRYKSFLLAFTAVLYALKSNYNIVKHQ